MSETQETKRTAELRLTDDVSSLRTYAPLFVRAIPEAMVDFVVGFLKRLQNLIGLEFTIAIPPHAQTLQPSVWPILRKLERLRLKGIVERYYAVQRSFPDEPRVFAAQVKLAGIDTEVRTGLLGYGSSLYSQEAAWGPAYGEAVERWCCEFFDPPSSEKTTLTTAELRAVSGLDLLQTAGMRRSKGKRSPHSASKLRYDIAQETTFVCVKAGELVSGSERYVPLQFFSFTHVHAYVSTGKEPVIQPLITTGSGAGETLEAATLTGLHEAIERDAFVLYWTRKITPKRIDVRRMTGRFAERVREIEERYRLTAHFLYLRTDFPVHVVACALIDETGKGPLVTIDAAAHASAEMAMEKAFVHTAGFRSSLRHRYTGAEERMRTESLMHKTRTLWWYPKERLDEIAFFIQGELIDCPPPYEHETPASEVEAIVRHCKKRNYPIYRKEIIPANLKRELGLSVVWIKVPDLLPLHLSEWERIEAGERLITIPQELDLAPAAQINPIPHPFS